jgi:hypothetical protein
MVGLWADVWFYISSFGLLVSGVLFFFLLSQYRAAAAAVDRAETETESKAPDTDAGATTPVQILYALPDPPQPKTKVASVAPVAAAAPTVEARPPEDTLILSPGAAKKIFPAPPPAPARPVEASEAPKPSAPKAPPPAPHASSEDVPLATASPAAAYLQGLKNQLDTLQDEVRGLSRRLDAANERDESMIARLAEISRLVSGLNQIGGPATPQLTSDKSELKELSISFDEKMGQSLSDMIDAHFADGTQASAAPAPAADAPAEAAAAPVESAPAPTESAEKPAAAEANGAEAVADPEASKPRRGPVWPV